MIIRRAGGWMGRVEAEGTAGVWKGGCGLLSAKTPLVSSDEKSNPNQLKALGDCVGSCNCKVFKWFSFRCHLIQELKLCP